MTGPPATAARPPNCAKFVLDMAILDIQMPTMSGVDAAQDIFMNHRIPVVIFSAYSDESYVSPVPTPVSSDTC